jgi:putative FmdB family regulatory protein
MIYEFRCPRCHKAFTEDRDPYGEKTAECPDCGVEGERVFSAQMGYIDWVNPDHGDGINLGLGKHFRSAAEREDWAKANGYEKLDR